MAKWTGYLYEFYTNKPIDFVFSEWKKCQPLITSTNILLIRMISTIRMINFYFVIKIKKCMNII